MAWPWCVQRQALAEEELDEEAGEGDEEDAVAADPAQAQRT